MKMPSLLTRLLGLRHSAIARRLTVYGASASISQLMMMVYGILVARQLGPDRYGIFASSYAVAGITIFFVNWGMDTWMLREGGTHPNTEKLSGIVLQTKLLMGLVWAVLLISIAPLIHPSLFPRQLILIVAFDQLFDSSLITFVSGLNIARRTGQASRVLLITRAGRLVGALLLILFFQSHAPLHYAVLRFSATALGVILGVLFLRPALSITSLAQPVETLRASFTYGIPELLSLIYAQADVLLVGFFDAAKQVGEYSPAVSLINAITVLPASVFYILVPNLTNTFLTRREHFSKAVRQMSLIYLGIGIALAAGCALVLSPLISIFLGEKYTITGQLALRMSPILFFKSISFAAATYLVVIGRQAKRIGVQLVSAILNVGLNLIFIPLYGAFGAATIFVISELVLAVGYVLTAVYYDRRTDPNRHLPQEI